MGRTESPNLTNDYERACGWYGHFNQSEMALFSECTESYAQKLLDTADIVREAILRQATKNTPHHRPATVPSKTRQIRLLLDYQSGRQRVDRVSAGHGQGYGVLAGWRASNGRGTSRA